MTISDQTKHVVDAVSVGTVVLSLSAWLPPIAAAVSIVWGVIRIYETKTVQSLLGRQVPPRLVREDE